MKSFDMASNNSKNSSSASGEDTKDNQVVTTSVSVNISQEDLNSIQWEGEAKQSLKKSKLKSQRRVEYKVDGVGVVAEEWRITSTSSSNEQPETHTELAVHSVFVNGVLVRQIDLKTNKVLLSEAKYEPFNFLRYGATGSTENQRIGSSEMVPVIGPGPAADDASKDSASKKQS